MAKQPCDALHLYLAMVYYSIKNCVNKSLFFNELLKRLSSTHYRDIEVMDHNYGCRELSTVTAYNEINLSHCSRHVGSGELSVHCVCAYNSVYFLKSECMSIAVPDSIDNIVCIEPCWRFCKEHKANRAAIGHKLRFVCTCWKTTICEISAASGLIAYQSSIPVYTVWRWSITIKRALETIFITLVLWCLWCVHLIRTNKIPYTRLLAHVHREKSFGQQVSACLCWFKLILSINL